MSETSKSIKQEIERLYFSKEYQDLVKYSEKFNIFKLMKIQKKELVHSNIISNLLTPQNPHGLGNLFLNEFINRIHSLNLFSGENLNLSDIISLLEEKIIIHREQDAIDIVIDFPEKKTIIAIENKIDNTERPKQISDYQDKLPQLYPKYDRYLLVFLTPDGKKPETANRKHKHTSILLASYNDILAITENVVGKVDGDIKSFLNQIIIHLKEDIVGDTEINKLCMEIYKKYPKAYQHLINNLPDLSSMETDYYRKIKDKYSGNENVIQTLSYPYRGIKTELQIWNKKWKIQNVHIKLFLDKNNYNIEIFAAIPMEYAKKYFDKLEKIFGVYPEEVRSDWSWWYFTKHGVCNVSNDDAFGEKTILQAYEKCVELYEHINEKLITFTA